MIARSEAEDHLRVIRSLMEKATIYRALSAPAALIGGILSLGTAAFLIWLERQNGPSHVSSNVFASVWGAVFAVTAAASFLLIWRDAQRRGESFFSVGARSALRAMLPPMLFAAVFTVACGFRDTVPNAVPWWITFYGLALLAMTHFAPRSLSILGWCFLIAGSLCVFSGLSFQFGSPLSESTERPCILMAATFGLFHLVYALCTWPRGSAAAQTHDV
jgi:hypothetical protein